MIEVTALDHIVLRTANVERLVAFYTQVLGCVVERTSAPEFGLTQLRAGSSLIDIVAVHSILGRQGGSEPTKQNNNLDHLCLRIKPQSEQAIKRHLSQYGVENAQFERRYGAQGFGRSLYITDSDGNAVELRCEQAFCSDD